MQLQIQHPRLLQSPFLSKHHCLPLSFRRGHFPRGSMFVNKSRRSPCIARVTLKCNPSHERQSSKRVNTNQCGIPKLLIPILFLGSWAPKWISASTKKMKYNSSFPGSVESRLYHVSSLSEDWRRTAKHFPK